MPWIRVADRDFAEGQKEIITAIEIVEGAGQGSPAQGMADGSMKY
jgi:hypothetical protein